MNDEDIKYRQGRRKQQVEASAVVALIGIVGIVFILFVIAFTL
mgnify:CR=1 FL=1